MVDIRYIHSWSGGKDSTAAVILDHIHGLPPSTVVFSEVMFDKRRRISGELPEHIDFVKNKAIPVFREGGYTVEILHSEKDYLDCFYHIVRKSKNPLRNGKKHGFLIGGLCTVNNRVKVKAINDYLKNINDEVIQYVGIAADEPTRLAKLDGTNKISLLAKFNYTENMAYELCRQYGLLSPLYQFAKRGGCWFCPNATYQEYAYLKVYHPELWGELQKLSEEKNLVSQNFKYGKTFTEIDKKVDEFIASGRLGR